MFVKEEYYLNLVFLVSLYSILSHSWNVFGGLCGQISLGHAAFFGVGALSCRYAWIAGAPLPAALLAGGIGSVLVTCIIGIPTLKLRSHYFAIGTLAMAMIALITVQNQLPGINFLPAELMAGYSVISRYYLCVGAAIAAVLFVGALKHSQIGLALISIREDEDAAASIGINVFRYKVVAMVISSFMAGVSGGLFAIYYVSFYRYSPFELAWSFDPLLITFIGGAGTVLGPVLGSISYVILREMFALSMGQLSVIIFGAVFILIVLFFPRGLSGLIDKFHARGQASEIEKQ
jgi:branched-chain amino acid transport system permease protein